MDGTSTQIVTVSRAVARATPPEGGGGFGWGWRDSPLGEVTVRAGTRGDLPFVDDLQKRNSRAVGWMPTKQLEGKIDAGELHVAEIGGVGGERVGYSIGQDRYYKRDDLGIVYQINVETRFRRAMVGATLVREMLARASYGCRLFCCWCAQDLDAAKFWRSLGFTPIAYRAGSRSKGRTHIFWQRRVWAGDTVTPYWYPCQTGAGLLREDRIVLPIPPGMTWEDELPRYLPGVRPDRERRLAEREELKRLAGDAAARAVPKRKKPVDAPPSKKRGPIDIRGGGHDVVAERQTQDERDRLAREDKAARLAAVKAALREKHRNDPRAVAAARELRDRYMEAYNAGDPGLPAPGYDVGSGRWLEGGADPRFAGLLPPTGVPRRPTALLTDARAA